jgi:hypothetical protein
MKARGNPAVELEMLLIVRQYFGTGGKVTSRCLISVECLTIKTKLRIRHSVPPLVFRAIEVARALHASCADAPAEWEEKGQVLSFGGVLCLF